MAKVEKRRALSEDRLRDFLREMLLIRRFEEKVEERFRAGDLPGFLHVAIGQEAVAVGVCQAMEDGDVFASTHRAHGHTLARGTHPNAVMAELYGQDVGEVYDTTREALERVRTGQGPLFLDVETYRMEGHYIGDAQVYRSKEDRAEAAAQDPIARLRRQLEVSDEEFESLDGEVHGIVEASVEFAKAGTDPQPEDALKNVYA